MCLHIAFELKSQLVILTIKTANTYQHARYNENFFIFYIIPLLKDTNTLQRR